MNAVPLLIPLIETGNLGPALLIIGALLLLSASFSGSETALNALQPMDREALKSAGTPGERVLALDGEARETLAAILMGNELVNISLSTVTAGLLLSLAPDKPWLNLVVATPLLILFGEVTPKSIALASPRRFALFISRPLSLWRVLVTPVRRILAAFVGIFLRLLGAEEEPTRVLQEDQVRKLIEEGHEAGSIKKLEHQLIDRLFHFSDTPVSRLMTPRPDVIAFQMTTPYPTLVAELKTHQVSRVPIYQGRLDNVIACCC
ncbi:MAG: DUF21 domain-containing protein [Alphaproteobacteria bacterium]|nr:DUF21 domain-containing protein [Alphaproteobacteria bacterium]